jgi:hypothetical protein
MVIAPALPIVVRAVFAATDGRVVAADGCPDRRWLTAIWEPRRLRPSAGVPH